MMKNKQQQYKEEGIEKSTDEIVLEVLGHGSGYIKGLGYGPKPTSRRSNPNSFATEQLQKEPHETQEKLHISEAQVGELKTQVQDTDKEVFDLRNQLAQQASNVAQQASKVEKLMAFMATQGMTV
ncbi:unnamed protein product [Cuscuta europaea]|uniref:Uncharacterized protein n=1 Tax=Cuscuta europaea TaxID=41803 RepID=A0A9P0YRH6_CUSEU|nr:unnamed protein product [Cuscuta europaea]